jgi:hypothetical protein
MYDLVAWLLISFASYRITRLLVFDSIIDGPRSWILRKLATTEKRGWKYELSYLIQCPYCLGVWTTLGLAAIWHYTPGLQPGVVVAAACGGQALLQSWERD